MKRLKAVTPVAVDSDRSRENQVTLPVSQRS
jgi:hypothetical protein